MDYKSMVKTEDTDIYYDAWEEYRKALTDYIIETVESFFTKKYLARTGKKRLTREYSMDNIIEEIGKKPVLAIWGAGGCNDMDIVRLSKYFKLVLIDYNLEKIKFAKRRFNLSDDDCICVDLGFWNFSESDYLMIEALLIDRVDERVLEQHIKDIIFNMSDVDYSQLPHFDFSVAVGLASQLNGRLAAMFYIHNYNMNKLLCELNELAVGKFINVISHMTKNMLILGYEEKCVDGSLREVERSRIIELNYMQPEEISQDMVSEVAGNEYLIDDLNELIDKLYIKKFSEKYLLWNFLPQKNYIMKLISMEY